MAGKLINEQADIEKALRQHVELEEFFAGDFARRAPAPIELGEDLMASDAAVGLKGIAGEVGKCCACELSETRTNIVPGEGSPDARIVFVGEAPGADEEGFHGST